MQTRAAVNEPVYTPEAGEHDGQIGDVQPADEEARPALEPAADQRGHKRRRRDDQAGRNIQQHALTLNQHRAPLNQRAQGHNQRQIHDVGADDVAHGERGFLFADGGEGRHQLRQGGADGDHRRGDDGIRHADHLRQRGAVVDQELRAEHDGRRAEHKAEQVARQRLAGHLRTVFRVLRAVLALACHQVFREERGEEEQDDEALRDGELAVAREREQHGDRRQQQRGLEAELPARHQAGHADQRQAHNQASVRRHRADRIAHGDIRVALKRRKDGDEHLRQRGGEADDRCADNKFRDAEGLAIHVAASTNQSPPLMIKTSPAAKSSRTVKRLEPVKLMAMTILPFPKRALQAFDRTKKTFRTISLCDVLKVSLPIFDRRMTTGGRAGAC